VLRYSWLRCFIFACLGDGCDILEVDRGGGLREGGGYGFDSASMATVIVI